MTDKILGEYSINIIENQSQNSILYHREMETYYVRSLGTNIDKLKNFPKFVPRPDINRFLVKNELFKKVLEVHGYIIECGVFLGGGLMSWAQFSSIYEPLNHVRRVVGFDSFQGFTSIHEKDAGGDQNQAIKGNYSVPALSDLEECIRLYDLDRPIGHISRVELIPGDACKTIPEYVLKNPHLVCALLYLDFDVYEPTKIAIESLFSKMPKGAIIAFDELNIKSWPGETQAVIDTLGINNLRIQRFPFQPQISYAILE